MAQTGEADSYITRGISFSLDPTPAQERLLRSYCGSVRVAHNWAISQVKENLTLRSNERAAGVAEADLAPSLSWSKYSLEKSFTTAKRTAAPWWQEVSMHAFRSGITQAADGLANFSASKKGTRAGRPVGFPHFKSRARSTPTISFVEINHQLSWFRPDRHAIRLMLPQSSPDPDLRRRREHLAWIHTIESTRRLYTLVERGRARIQKVTISYRSGRWQVSFSVRCLVGLPARKPGPRGPKIAGVVGLDAGVSHLATLSVPIPGVTNEDGHIANPRHLEGQLEKLAKLDRALARTQPGSNNRVKVRRRRARLHGRIAKTRDLALHATTNALLDRVEVLAIEDLALAGMQTKKRHLGRSLADASLGELRRQLTYKAADRGVALVAVDRFYPSSKICSSCGSVKAKLDLGVRIYECDTCSLVLDRDANAAINIAREGTRLLEQQRIEGLDMQHVAGLRPETRNADPRQRKTTRVHALVAAVA
jgi:putative transposase